MNARDEPRPAARSEFSSDDPRRIREHLRSVYGSGVQIECQGSPHARRFTHIRHKSSGLMIDQISHSGDGAVSTDHLADTLVLWVHAGKVAYSSADDHVLAARGDVFLLGPGRRTVCLQAIDARFTAVHVIHPARHGEQTTAPPCLRPRSESAADSLKRTIAYASDVLNTGDDVVAEVMSEALPELVRAAVYAGFPHPCSGDGAPNQPSQPVALRQAMAYIEANAARRITIADLAAEIYATPRTVQYLFRRHLGTTPTAYLRRVRLSKARQELLTGDRTVTTVTATATRWGFAHTGRFAVLYRETYGESPHQTLSR
ncbi:helix-turn-helix transcriptional regulator [Mycolicibacterium chubuense]|uniref:helix-turn-helix transcriptional regulator n=1 Tax=Mycolicibacterium chubuense TaxID=1800 RepID=UPI0002D4421A|nr:helix-turn-helix transcriptional regulator [Mycolicibacterium chubuense]